MNKYKESKIYKITSEHTNKIYIGSTAEKYLSQRKAVHASLYKRWKAGNKKQYCASYELYKLGDVKYELLELYNCNSKKELLERERYFMELNTGLLINKNRTGISEEEKKNQHNECNKKYYIDAKEKFKQYYIDNQEKLKQYQREYLAKKKAQI
jgi:hypothetical protein